MTLERTADYVVLDGRFLLAEIVAREGRSITANLYKNPKALEQGDVMERGVRLWLNRQPYHLGCSTFSRPG